MKKALLLSALTIALTLSASAGKRIVVNLSQQRACAYEGGRTVFCGNISTGKPGHRTPNGRFRVLEKDIDHVSSKYPEPNGGAKMHYMLRLTSSGIAMHLGYVPNYPASHGCIRMQSGFAQRMYSWAHVGVPVSIIGSAPARVSRSGYRTVSQARSVRRTYHADANDILAEFMGRPARARARSRRAVNRKSRRHHVRPPRRTTHATKRKRHRRVRHPHPLNILSAQ